MIPEWMRARDAELRRLKAQREGAAMYLDEHRSQCSICKGRPCDDVAAGECAEGAKLALEYIEVNKAIRELI